MSRKGEYRGKIGTEKKRTEFEKSGRNEKFEERHETRKKRKKCGPTLEI